MVQLEVGLDDDDDGVIVYDDDEVVRLTSDVDNHLRVSSSR